MEMMKVAAITDVGKTQILEVEKPVPRAGEILVQIKACALCTTEQRVFRGITDPPKPYMGGHEAAGVVVGLGDELVEDWEIGQRVILRTFPSCGVCYYCKKGYNNQCINLHKVRGRHGLQAGLAEYIALPEYQLFPYNGALTFPEAAIGEPVSCVTHSITLAQIDLGDDVVIIGAGIMGMLHLQLAKLRGARVLVAEIDPARQQIARELGADVVFSPKEVDQVAFVRAQTGGRGADVVINTTSIYEVAGQAMQMSAKLGRTILYAAQHPDEPVPVKLGEMHSRETKLIGTVSPTTDDFRRATKLLEMGAVNVKPLIAHVVPFADFQKALELATPGTYRVVVSMEQ